MRGTKGKLSFTVSWTQIMPKSWISINGTGRTNTSGSYLSSTAAISRIKLQAVTALCTVEAKDTFTCE